MGVALYLLRHYGPLSYPGPTGIRVSPSLPMLQPQTYTGVEGSWGVPVQVTNTCGNMSTCLSVHPH